MGIRVPLTLVCDICNDRLAVNGEISQHEFQCGNGKLTVEVAVDSVPGCGALLVADTASGWISQHHSLYCPTCGEIVRRDGVAAAVRARKK
jgi:hypothetical protein